MQSWDRINKALPNIQHSRSLDCLAEGVLVEGSRDPWEDWDFKGDRLETSALGGISSFDKRIDKAKKIYVQGLLAAHRVHHGRDTLCGPSEAEAEASRCWSEAWQEEEECPHNVGNFDDKMDETDDTSPQAFAMSGEEYPQDAQNLDDIEDENSGFSSGDSSAPGEESSEPWPSYPPYEDSGSHQFYNAEIDDNHVYANYSALEFTGAQESLSLRQTKDIGEVFSEEHPPASRLVSGNDLNRNSSSQILNSKATVPSDQGILIESKLPRNSTGKRGPARRLLVTSRSRARPPSAQRNNTPIFGTQVHERSNDPPTQQAPRRGRVNTCTCKHHRGSLFPCTGGPIVPPRVYVVRRRRARRMRRPATDFTVVVGHLRLRYNLASVRIRRNNFRTE